MAMRKSFKDSLKALEADIQHANTLYKLSFCLSISLRLNWLIFWLEFFSAVARDYFWVLE